MLPASFCTPGWREMSQCASVISRCRRNRSCTGDLVFEPAVYQVRDRLGIIVGAVVGVICGTIADRKREHLPTENTA